MEELQQNERLTEYEIAMLEGYHAGRTPFPERIDDKEKISELLIKYHRALVATEEYIKLIDYY